MNEEYLWEKQGEDAEIEKLESLLTVYRYEETGPPTLPALNVIEVVGKPSPWRVYLQLAFGAGALAAIVMAVWFGVSSFRKTPERSVALTTPPVVQSESKAPVASNPTTPEPTEPRALVKAIANNKSKAIHSRPRYENTVAKTSIRKPETVRLTKEEKYAYSQLLLALSIASAKFQLVHDTIQKLETPKTSSSEK